MQQVNPPAVPRSRSAMSVPLPGPSSTSCSPTLRSAPQQQDKAMQEVNAPAVPRSRSAISVPLPGPSSTSCSPAGRPICIHVCTHQMPTSCVGTGAGVRGRGRTRGAVGGER